MKKKEPYTLKTLTDIKVFLLFILDNIKYPVDHSTIMKIVAENIDEPGLDYEEGLSELVERGFVISDSFEGTTYYVISKTGQPVAAELYDILDESLRERSIRSAIKHSSLLDSGLRTKTEIEELPSHRFKVTVTMLDSVEEVMSASFTVVSRLEAERIRENFETRPQGMYSGFLFAATGRMEYLS
ncbi:MAG: DUF4364 family protein [Clostridia bacterium]|nr:DUF4364 family protein [Clostridia bacterium]